MSYSNSTNSSNSTNPMNPTNPGNPTNPNNPINPLRTHLIFLPIILLLFVLSYHSTLSWMYHRYMAPDSYYSHGFIIPFVSGFLIWQKRNQLTNERPKFSWWGLFFIFFAVIIHIIGTTLYVFSLSGFSIFFLIMGISFFFLGNNSTRIVLFSLFFLLFMFPLPTAFLTAILFPMKMMVAKASVAIVNSLGIPAYREGFYITIPAGTMLVGNPCSGLRSLISFLALGSIFAHISSISNIKKWILFSLAIPIALLSNMVRVPILLLISQYWGLSAASPDSFWHDASGIFVFVIGLFLLFYAGRVLRWKSSETDM